MARAGAKRSTRKLKIGRSLGVNLWGQAKSPFNKRKYKPGQHGPTSRGGNSSDYAKQMRAKQTLKGYYGNIGEKKFRAYYLEASNMRGDTPDNLIGLLERRLDAVVYRAKLAPTVFSARQLVSHGHIYVNDKRVKIASYQVKPGDVITVSEKAKQMPLVVLALESAERHNFLEYDLRRCLRLRPSESGDRKQHVGGIPDRNRYDIQFHRFRVGCQLSVPHCGPGRELWRSAGRFGCDLHSRGRQPCAAVQLDHDQSDPEWFDSQSDLVGSAGYALLHPGSGFRIQGIHAVFQHEPGYEQPDCNLCRVVDQLYADPRHNDCKRHRRRDLLLVGQRC